MISLLDDYSCINNYKQYSKTLAQVNIIFVLFLITLKRISENNKGDSFELMYLLI